MECTIKGCTGEYQDKEVVRAIRQGDEIIVVEHIPASEEDYHSSCTNCSTL